MNRRQMLGGLAACVVPGVAVAAAPARRPLVVVVLRGGLDGLAAVPPIGDPDYARCRGELALPHTLPLDGDFALHPALGFLHESFRAGELAVLHAASTPYRDRSHFDGQDVLESGADHVFGADTGWLSTALARRGSSGVAVGPSTPLLLRGPGQSTTWSPARLAPPDDDTLERLADLYAGHAVLAAELAAAEVAGSMRGARGDDRALVESAAGLLAVPGGPEAAVVSVTGWDTHANQGAADGVLTRRLQDLDAGLRALREGLGASWSQTTVLVLTEFGRTVRVNGTKGTDHGTGAAAFALGGAVRGGLLGDWPGLARLHEDRDLVPANDVRSLAASVLAGHWGVDDVFSGVPTSLRVIRG